MLIVKPTKKINRITFLEKFKPILDMQTTKMFQSLFPKIKDTFPESKLYQLEQLKIDKNFLIYNTYVLESPWHNAPYEDFFRKFNKSSCSIDHIPFILTIEDSFLKTKSRFSFQFSCQR